MKPRLSAHGGFDPRLWAGFVPNGMGQVKPDHFGEMVKTAWQNRGNLPYAWRILTRGVCDGCALGTAGLKDFTMPGVHLCTVRLNLLHLNTMKSMAPDAAADVAALRGRTSRELRGLGRLAHPLLRRRGEPGFRRVSWDEALDVIATRVGEVVATDPDRFACYVTSRGITNEVYYALQKATRALGTNNVDNSARLCHAPSTVVLKETLGVTGSTCSYADWIGTDLLVFLGSDVANNQPVATKYIYYAKQQGTQVVVVNPMREPGLDRYWIPSVLESAVFGTKLADHHFPVHTGGDAAFLSGTLKALIVAGRVDRAWIEARTEGFAELEGALAQRSWDDLARRSGSTREEMERFAAMCAEARSAIFVWSMGLTQHVTGADQVRSVVNLALARGMVGRPHTGLVPIRGHSGVQGGSEVGCVPNALPGGRALDDSGRAAVAAEWGFLPPARRGLAAVEMIEAAHAGALDAFFIVGGNFLETLPDPARVEEALARVPLRVHQDIVLTSAMLVDPADTVVVLPARTRYEQTGGGTETSTERRILMSPEIPGPRPAEARDEWHALSAVAARVRPGLAPALAWSDAQEIRDEIARAVPFYRGIETLKTTGDQVQYGGPLLGTESFDRPGGRARFSVIGDDALLPAPVHPRSLKLTTRRGKQFNSMVHAGRDPLTGARREDILMSGEDAWARGLADGDPIVVRSAQGTFAGRVRVTPILPGNVQGFWPEVNGLFDLGRRDAASGVPDYGAEVTIERPADGREER